MSEYQEQAEDFLTRHNLKFEAVLIGSDCPRFCEDADKGEKMDEINTFPRRSHIHGKHYRCTIMRVNAPASAIVYDFWNSYADEEQNYWTVGGRNMPSITTDYKMADKYKGKKPVKVRAYDLLACIQKYDVGTFKDFCGDFGYSDDSMKAFTVYQAVQEEFAKTRRFFTYEELTELREIN